MIEQIYEYYQNERNTAYIAIAIGVAFLASAFILFQYFGNDRLAKGLYYVFFVSGLFFLTAGIPVAIHNNRKMAEVSLSSKTNKELHKSEIVRMELVMKTGYRSALILFSSLVIGGLAVLSISPNDFWKGIGLGLLIFGTTGHLTEALSIQKNKAYQQKIDSIKLQNI